MKQFQKLLAMLIAMGFLMSSDVFHVVVHIPSYLHHKLEHHQKENISFFLLNHSSDYDNSNHNDDSHDGLPFCHQHNSDCNHTSTYTIGVLKHNVDLNIPLNEVLIFYIHQEHLPHGVENLVWQPPKLS